MKKFTKLLISGAMIALLSTGLTLGHIYRNEIKDFFTGVFAKAEIPSKPTGEEIKGFKFSGNKISGYSGTEVNLQSLPSSYSKYDEHLEEFEMTMDDLNGNEEVLEKMMNHSFNCQPKGKEKFYCADAYDWEEKFSLLFETEEEMMQAFPLKIELLKTTYYNGDDFQVTAIGDYAFSENTIITDVVIPDNITEIGGGAFQGCSSLINVRLGKNIKSLDMTTFLNCESLENINLENISEFGSSAFEGCSSLKNVTLNSHLKKISERMFASSGLTSITIPSSVEKIEMLAFNNCSNLSHLTIPEGVKELGASFIDGTAIKKLELPSTIEIADYVNFLNENLEILKINIDLNMTQLLNILYSNNAQIFVKSEIEKECFNNENINNFAQYNGRIFSLDEYTGEKVQRTGLITDFRFQAENAGVAINKYLGNDTKLILPDFIRYEFETLLNQTISSKEDFYAFYEANKDLQCYEISYMSIDRNEGSFFENINEFKTFIDENYSTTSNLFPMDVQARNMYVYESEYGVPVQSIDLHCFENNQTIEEVVISDTCKTIGEMAFKDCVNLKKVVLGENCKSIAQNSFQGTTEDLVIVIQADEVPNVFWSNQIQHILGKVYVLDELYETFTTSEGWSNIASQIHRLSELEINDVLVNKIN